MEHCVQPACRQAGGALYSACLPAGRWSTAFSGACPATVIPAFRQAGRRYFLRSTAIAGDIQHPFTVIPALLPEISGDSRG
ncbi:hypothetical protein [Fulvivirga sedimenti]|uniref:Uncharacterized protein n=1 Tax=Fulvivirga sedimenti TaxID=2879465 RepID=A0A9X1HRQ2_9BACT|nr:hypothetical protein [Fulvivirga sedimenti]MCA6074977.1 hypothetical protein [Fulvivirga sedimenti]MCA6076154.1 hypothetical protein [Fulvivirga sedimenti]MCA6077282.1 hypothetical protein [Fulvivirga sedimenti]